jgi:drug/metabolite transporter (DMT)-like permease
LVCGPVGVVFSTFGGYGFYWLNLKLSSVSRVSSLIYLTPPTTIVWAYLMFGESVTLLAILGLAVCFGGVLLASRGA